MSHRRTAQDTAFDAVFPAAIRLLSARFWTPVEVARRAAAMIQAAGVRRVLDVGSGPGKFALVAAMAAPDVEFVGVERRPHLVAAARRAKAQLAIPNARFHIGDAADVEWEPFDGFYFFNPFAENLFVPDERIDGGAELGVEQFMRDVRAAERALQRVRVGSVVLTYHGTGTRMPGCFDLERSERAGSDELHLWVKRRESVDGEYVVEEGAKSCTGGQRGTATLLTDERAMTRKDGPKALV